MITRRTALGLIASPLFVAPARADDLEPSYLRLQIEKGELPPVAQRLPKVPRVINVKGMGREPGLHGGVLRTLISSARDISSMSINGYARLVGYDESFVMWPDILAHYDVVEDRVFTFSIRDGHKWSDGQPLTAEDFRYCWEDVYLDEALTPGGVPAILMVDGKPPTFEIVDPLTVRYTWPGPNPDFLPSLAAAQATVMAMPAHYLKQFHKKYASEEQLDVLLKKYKDKKWTRLHTKMSRQYRQENPELPVLDPWRNNSPQQSEQFIYDRNPFFHQVDENGRQLPYIDKVVLGTSSSSIIPAKTGAGESDLQSMRIDFTDYTFLKEAEKRYPFKVSLWKRTQGSRIALFPNLNYEDEVWRNLLRDVRMRRALSLAIDRHEINMAVFFGLGKESADTLLQESPLYKEEYAKAWCAHDPAQANALLDELGLVDRDDDGFRILQDGRLLKIVVETSGESTFETDVLELVKDHWSKVGVGLFPRTSQTDIFRSRAIGGKIMMGVWSGMDNGVATADMNPAQLAPTADDQLQWPVWGLNYQSRGESGSPPDMPEVQELVQQLRRWRASGQLADRVDAWHRMLAIYSDQVFSIGIVNGGLQPVVRSTKLRNMPEKGLYSYNPSCYFGVYRPTTFWLDERA